MESLEDRIKLLEEENRKLKEAAPVKTWEELYGAVKSNVSDKMSFKEYKQSGLPRTFAELLGENDVAEKLQESYDDIYKKYATKLD